ncbi:hypothetical protein GCM10010964_00410 [Caldovatus sediminis]|uniref:Activator of Hsp90 ATPase homologue 1/2-like C-terminal domain-containing protein n=1 Tax=Caldovatus sediminis TaxID=2041189 RepID=A0A8J2Z796_9PROT|nr:SRPBCC domain-containing protein [Caldovatus sediminis]GGG16000.1 hypothetical protein GCM10010964_00410 [Caldovatus sediminis]
MTTANPASAGSGAIDRDLVLTREFDAPREVVFRAWTDSVRLAQWWGPHGFSNPVCELDPRPAGAIRIHMRGPDGSTHPHRGLVREILEPERLVLTMALEDEAGRTILEVLTRVTLAEAKGGGRTRLTLQASVIRAAPGAEPYLRGMAQGWNESLQRLATTAATGRAAEEPSLVLVRRFRASPALVYRAWTRPEMLAQWWGPHHTRVERAELDPRVGGRFRVVLVEAGSGQRHEVSGTYAEVEPERRLVFSWAWASTPERVSRVTVTFRPVVDGTEITLLHDRFADADTATRHRRGWTESLERLAARVAVGDA